MFFSIYVKLSGLFFRGVTAPLAAALALWLVLALPAGARADQLSPYFTDLGQFNYARFLMDEGDYRAAAKEFSRLIESFPASPLISEAQFKMGEAYLYSGRYAEAETQFRLFISNFQDSPFSVVAEVKIQEARERGKKYIPRPLPERLREMRPGLRAVQVMFFEGRTYAEVENEIKALKSSGVDTVILRVFHNKGDRFYPVARQGADRGVYFKTLNAPVVDDILPGVLDIAHRNGIKVFAWMTTRYADYGVEGGSECASYGLAEREFGRCKGLDLFSEEAIERLERLYSDLAAYDIDGVLFQDDLILRHNEGFGSSAMAAFARDTGMKLDPESLYVRGAKAGQVHYTKLFWKWSSWKNRRLVAVAERLMHTVKRKRPEAMFAINLMYESVTNPPYALAWLSQDLGEALNADFDYYSIMAYHRQMGQELQKDGSEIRDMIARMVADAANAIGEPRRVLMKVQTIDWKTGAPLENDEVVDLIREIKGVRDVSMAVVPYRGGFPFGALAGGVASLD
ncbi:MAG: tetratricopeptide repeat protein [Deltaproteobacteria bacterium]|nr:tetratricopeptide repeat protein [Deltaproteobacteria bacterium]